MKLIDADAFSKVMKKRQDACSEWVKEAKGNYRYRALGAWSILSEIKLTLDKIPTIDAVEVVHCRDCKYWYPNGIGFCTIHDIRPSQLDMADWFCADGEEKSNG